MKFDDLDRLMRSFETQGDHHAPADALLVARIDGRGFTKLTKEKHQFEAPFDEGFRNMMIGTTRHLMDCGFRVSFAYTQSDEISLFFHPAEATFGRKIRKYNSILAGEASAKFSLLLGDLAVFDCRIIVLPSLPVLVDYARWRQEDARRNALNAHCYWALRGKGNTVAFATEAIRGLSSDSKRILLLQEGGIQFDELPSWQRLGIGAYPVAFEKPGVNPLTGETIMATRRQLHVDFDLPERDEYARLVFDLVASNE